MCTSADKIYAGGSGPASSQLAHRRGVRTPCQLTTTRNRVRQNEGSRHQEQHQLRGWERPDSPATERCI